MDKIQLARELPLILKRWLTVDNNVIWNGDAWEITVKVKYGNETITETIITIPT